MNKSRLLVFGICLASLCVPAFAGVSAVPEPKLEILTVVGVGAIILVGRKLKKR